MLNVEILGGVGEYGRNCFYIEKAGRAILLDCGVMNNAAKALPNLTPKHVAKLEAVFISHSHIDHVGALPLLRKLGYGGEIVMSQMTAKQLAYTEQAINIFPSNSAGSWLTLHDQLAYQWGYSGHLIGGVWFKIRFLEEVIFFSGDYVLDAHLLKATLPEADGTYDLAIMDSGHFEKSVENQRVLQQITECILANPNRPIVFPSAYSGKTADIAAYVLQQTKRDVVADPAITTLFADYVKAPEFVKADMQETARSLQRIRTAAEGIGTETICFLSEHAGDLQAFLQKHPNALVIFTGYMKQPIDKRRVATGKATHFFYKTHPDYEDVRRLTTHIQAKETIYFHSTFTNRDTTLLTLLGEENKK